MNLRTGKINDDVYDRSVVKRLGDLYIRPQSVIPVYETTAAAIIAEDHPENACGAVVTSDATVTSLFCNVGSLALRKACNELAAQAAMPIQAAATVLLPEGCKEQCLRDIEDDLERAARTIPIRLREGLVEVTAAVTRPVVAVHAMGARLCAVETDRTMPSVRMYIVASKWAGLAGTWILARERDEELRQIFSTSLLETAIEMGTLTNAVPEARAMVAGRIPCAALVSCGTGGIYAALWKVTQRTGHGFEVYLPDIPIRQETIEICNHYDINPYTMESAGCLLCVTPEPQALIRVWNDAGIHAAIIGTLSEDHDMRIVNGDETAYLNKPQGDALDEMM